MDRDMLDHWNLWPGKLCNLAQPLVLIMILLENSIGWKFNCRLEKWKQSLLLLFGPWPYSHAFYALILLSRETPKEPTTSEQERYDLWNKTIYHVSYFYQLCIHGLVPSLTSEMKAKKMSRILTLIRFCGIGADPSKIKTVGIWQQDSIQQRFFR